MAAGSGTVCLLVHAAEELRKLIRTKYDKTYDVSIVRRDIPGKTFVSARRVPLPQTCSAVAVM